MGDQVASDDPRLKAFVEFLNAFDRRMAEYEREFRAQTPEQKRISELLEINNKFEARARSAERMLQAAIELIGNGIYDGWKDKPGWVEWVPLGNSRMQCAARREAMQLIEGTLL